MEPDRVSEKQSAKLARDITTAIEQDLVYPGEIKVTVMRQTKTTEVAR